jgi:hypothetical protein
MNYGGPSPYFSYAMPNFQSQLPPIMHPAQNPATFMSILPPQSPQTLYSSAPNLAFLNPPPSGGFYNHNVGKSPLTKSGNYVSDFTRNVKRSKGLKLFSDVFSRADKNGTFFFSQSTFSQFALPPTLLLFF